MSQYSGLTKIYFDTEFTGLKKNTTLVSIGLIASVHDCVIPQFYAEFTDYDKEWSKQDKWFAENVESKLIHTQLANGGCPDYINNYHLGDKATIKMMLTQWLNQFAHVQLVSDVCHYDMVLFTDIFGTAFDLPNNVSPYCYDINQDIAKLLGITEREAFDVSREKFAGVAHDNFYPDNVSDDRKHNALWDARVIKACDEVITARTHKDSNEISVIFNQLTPQQKKEVMGE